MNTLKMKYNFLDFVHDLGIAWKYALNGLIGGIVWSLYKKSKFWEAFRQVIIGAVVSGYLTPVIVYKTNMSLELIGCTSFVIGMTGMVIIDSTYKMIVKKIKNYKQAIFIVNNKKDDAV